MARNSSSSRELGPYELLETLGSGSSAKVYRARNKFLGTEVAMKVLHTPLVDDLAERFLDEARTIAHLQHPNIVRVLGFDVEQSIPYLVMDFAPLGSLRQRHPAGTRLPLSVVVSYVKQVASALQYAHDRDETHLDVKPENMLIGKHGEVLLSDFGIAGNIQAQHPQMMGSVVGTVPYMAPEQIRGRPGKASDQYALATVTFEWLDGMYPFEGTKQEIARQHLKAQPPSLCARNPLVPPAVERVIMKALSKDPAQRYPSISAFAFALEEASEPVPPAQEARADSPGSASTTVNQSEKQPAPLVIPCIIVLLMILAVIAWPIVAAIVHPVTITITPNSTQLEQTNTLVAMTGHPDPTRQQVQARYINTTSPPESETVNATGVGQTPGIHAQGVLTFYNGLPGSQTVAQGTEITASNGSEIVTDAPANIPPANPPSSFGTIEISAHALNAGSNGNIATGSINKVCCSTDNSISVKNLAPFSGGQDPQRYTYVQQSDINGADAKLEPGLKTAAQQSLQKQIRSNEAGASPMHCLSNVSPDPAINTRVATVQVTVKLQCYEEVYDKAEATKLFMLMLKNEAFRRFGASYALLSAIAVHFLSILVKNDLSGNIILRASAAGIWVYQFSNAQKQALLKLINGEKVNNAKMLLSRQPGVSKADIQAPFWVPWFIQDTLPMNVNHATLNIAPVTA
ncbi:MAG: protein kinase domain-containing protein [Ktedonobacteraceae bacterium]